MFTGIIQATAPVLASDVSGKVRRVRVKKPARWVLRKGESVSIEGICSTVAAVTKDSFFVAYMPETLRKTTAGTFEKGVILNLERSLRFGDPIDGHLVQGHVDARAEVRSARAEGTSRLITVRVPGSLASATALHGSIAINGVSLTIARKKGSDITVALIPYTLSHTNLKNLSRGSMVNIETDAILRNLRFLKKNAKVSRNAR